MTEQPTPRRRRHLMDPHQPRPAPDPEAIERLHRVQRTVISVLVVTTVLHLSVGLAIASAYVAEDRLDAQIGLNVVSAVTMVFGVGAALVIHKRPWLSPWLLIGLVPGLVGIWWVVLR